MPRSLNHEFHKSEFLELMYYTTIRHPARQVQKFFLALSFSYGSSNFKKVQQTITFCRGLLHSNRVSFKISFDSKQPKLTKTSFGTIRNKMFVSVVSLLYRNREFRQNRNKKKTNRNSLIESIYWYFFIKFCVVSGCFGLDQNSLFRLFRILYRNSEFQCFD